MVSPKSLKRESPFITVAREVEILEPKCFPNCKLLENVSFEDDSHLDRIKAGTFQFSSIRHITIPRKVETLDDSQFFARSIFTNVIQHK